VTARATAGSPFAARLRWLSTGANAELVRHGQRGVEKESLRVQANGHLSRRPHPRALGAALTHPYITTDYSESLPEFVTPPQRTNWETLQFLSDLHAFTHRRLDGETLWPASMPCELDGNEAIPIADYGASNAGLMKTVYRRGLGHRYGRAMQAIAGVHFNYSPPTELWPALREHSGDDRPLDEFRSAALMGLVRNYRRCAWLVTYLFGASPALAKSFRPEGHELLAELDAATWHAPFATSLRMSDFGYRNKSQGRLRISANSLDEYVAGMTAAVSTLEPRYAEIGVRVDGEYRQLNANILQIENEYYSAIRPKPSKASDRRPVVALREHGVEYVEVRTLDLSPNDPAGVSQAHMRFVEALLIHCLLADSPPIDAAEQEEIDRHDVAVAREGRKPGLAIAVAGRERSLVEHGLELVDALTPAAELLDRDGEGYAAVLEHAREALREPERTPSATLLRALRDERAGFFEYTLALALDHGDYFRGLPLAEDRDARLAAVAADSLRAARELEEADRRTFDAYLTAFDAEL
jgi:glutamate--cysteine ligase